MFNKCKEMEQEYTGNNFIRQSGQPYLLSNPDELNILADAMEKRLGLRYTTHLISGHPRHNSLMQCVSALLIYTFLDSNC